MNIFNKNYLYKIKYIFFKIILILIILLNISYAEDKIYIKDVIINDIKNIPKTYINKLFLYKNNYISYHEINKIIKYIYKTEIFKEINIYIKNNILIINLKKNLIINSINFSKNKSIKSKYIKKILKKYKLTNNEFLNEKKLFKFKLEIINSYNDIGKYNLEVIYDIKKVKDKVDILINLNEGNYSRIKYINIIGNNNIKKKIILKKLEINNNFIFKRYNSIYKRKIFIKNLYKLKNFYKNNGYLNFYIKKLDINFSKNMNNVYITLLINEGNKFLIKNCEFCGDFDKSYINDLKKICNFNKKEIFNDLKLKKIINNIKNFFLNKGYKKPKIKLNIIFDKKNEKLIILNFGIKSGKRLMVRNINIFGNKYISDNIIRKNISHSEYSELNYKKINNDLIKLNKLKYFNNINIKIKKIELNKDIVDVIYNVREINFNKFNIEADIKNKKSNLSIYLNKINWLESENSMIIQTKYNNPEYEFSINIDNLFYFNKNENKISSSILKKSFIINDDFNKIIVNNKSILNGLTIPIKNNYFHKYDIFFEENNSLYSKLNKKNSVNLLEEYLLKKNNASKFIKYKNFSILTEINYNYLNHLILPNNGINLSLLINNSLPISYSKFYKIFFNINNFYNINYKNFIINNKIQFILINNKNDKETLLNEYLYLEDYIDKVRGFDCNYMSNKFNFEKITKYKKNKIKKTIKSNSQLFFINELLFPDNFFKNKFKNILQISLFLDMSLNFNLSKNYFLNNKNLYINSIKHKHLSTGINIRWLSPMGLLKAYYAVPILKCKEEKINNFKCGFSL